VVSSRGDSYKITSCQCFHQTARFLHQQKQPRLLLKLDISKAFDFVSWPFLLEILQHMGFRQIWRDIISGLLCSSTTQVLLNGTPGRKIFHRRGLRQGDPLSPMLFFLENAGELRFIILRRIKMGKKSSNTRVTPLHLKYICFLSW
jgi:hypothetical protein